MRGGNEAGVGLGGWERHWAGGVWGNSRLGFLGWEGRLWGGVEVRGALWRD